MKMQLLEYSMQLAMLKQLYNKGLISDKEYQKMEQRLKKDYGIVSNITA
ncbi:SHOCT domain-containing protein [Candidatus Enterococcus leclercqii]|jgi:uncharacterized membrane protein|nr:SHOCT domain-containing protein [Enterococcus sp. CU9D]KAF1290191.1 conjugal transfer protein [Enterococcus sp. CU9D]